MSLTSVESFHPPGVAEALIYTPGWWTLMVLDNGVPMGSHWEVTILGNSVGTYWLNSDYYEDAGPNDILTINVIPEPMTVCMMVLGGLVLLRKQRR